MADLQVNRQKSNELAQRQNEAYFPHTIGEIQDDFGVKPIPIYIYNVAPLEHNEPRPPNHPHMFIRKCPPTEPYILTGQIEHPFKEVYRDDNGEQHIRRTNGYREATRMLSPSNPGTDQNWEQEGLAHGSNLNNIGVFWSVNNPPKTEEVLAARQRMEKDFRAYLAKMVEIEAQEGPEAMRGYVNHKARAAADYFGQSYSWHRTDLVPKRTVDKVDCGACGEKISSNARICKECGAPTDPKKLEAWLAGKFDARQPVAAK